MPHGTAYDLEVVKTVKAKTVKKEAEETLEIWKPETGKRFRLAGFTIFLATAQAVVTLEDETTVCFMAAVEKLAAGAVFNLPQGGYLSVKAGNKLNLKVSAENAVTASFYGIEDVA